MNFLKSQSSKKNSSLGIGKKNIYAEKQITLEKNEQNLVINDANS